MHTLYKSLANPIRLLFLTALIVTLGFTLSAQLSHHKSYADDTARLLVAELQEASADAEPIPQLDDISAILTSAQHLQFSGNLNPHHLFFSEFAPRLTFLYHIRPRSPPARQTS